MGQKFCCKVSLYTHCQRQSCRAINCLSSGINILAGGRPLPPEILPPSDLPRPEGSEFWHILPCSASTARDRTRRPASADRRARRQFQATGQPVSRTQASDAMTSRLPRYEAKCVQRRCFQCGSVPLRSDMKGTELPPSNILIPLERQLIALQLCLWELLYNETLQQTSFRPSCIVEIV